MSTSITTINGRIVNISTPTNAPATPPLNSSGASASASGAGVAPASKASAIPGSGLPALVDLFSTPSAAGSRDSYLAHVKLPPLDSSLNDDEDE